MYKFRLFTRRDRSKTTTTAMTATLPPLRQWSKTRQNRCASVQIPAYWKAYDAITFLVDLGIYQPSFNNFLTREEKERELRFKLPVSRQRFVVSRTLLKHILCKILSQKDPADITLIRNEDGRILVRDHPSVSVSLSYSGTGMAITVAKRKTGSDMETVRPVHDKKITSSPVFGNLPSKDEKERIRQVIHIWTLVEACAKFHDINPYPLLDKHAPFNDTNLVSYCIDRHAIFSLACGPDPFTDVLVWLDTDCMKKIIS